MNRRPQVHLRLWLQSDTKILLGLGRADLLQRIGELGSLKKAAASLGMSYRAAWGRIRRTEDAVGFALIEPAETKREGCRLTPAGREAVEAFLTWHEDVYAYALKHADALPFSTKNTLP